MYVHDPSCVAACSSHTSEMCTWNSTAPVLTQVLAEKLGVPDAEDQAQISAQRNADPDSHADGASRWYHARCGPRLCAPEALIRTAVAGAVISAGAHAG